jgi:hypothetical protein
MGKPDPTRFFGRDVTAEDLATVKQIVAEYPGLPRHEIAATVCEAVGWLRASGSPMTRECREWLEGLEAMGEFVLPYKRATCIRYGTSASTPTQAEGEPGAPLEGTVRDFAPILIERVTGPAGRKVWRELVGRHHYLGYATPYGAHLRYLVRVSRPEPTIVGCVQVSSPAWRMAARDRWIGWDDETRAVNLQRIVNNSRFLLLPWVKVANLASTVLSRIARQVGPDWKEQYGIEPLLLETLVDQERFQGTCYRAAGWADLGSTTGRGRMDREHRREGLVPKTVFVLPLVKDAAARLCEATATCGFGPEGPLKGDRPCVQRGIGK